MRPNSCPWNTLTKVYLIVNEEGREERINGGEKEGEERRGDERKRE